MQMIQSDVQCPDQLLGNSHHRRGNSKAEDGNSEERVDWQTECADRLTAEWQQECHKSNQPLYQHSKVHTHNYYFPSAMIQQQQFHHVIQFLLFCHSGTRTEPWSAKNRHQ